MSCKICYLSDNVVQSPCNHSFCSECIEEWLIIEQICPYCRQEFTLENLVESRMNCTDEIITRSKISVLKNKALIKYVSVQLDLIKTSLCLELQKILVHDLFKYLYLNRYYIHFLNGIPLMPIIIEKLENFYFERGVVEMYEWYFKFTNYNKERNLKYSNIDMK